MFTIPREKAVITLNMFVPVSVFIIIQEVPN